MPIQGHEIPSLTHGASTNAWPKERSKLRAGELSAIDKAVDLLSSEEVGRTQGPMSSGATGGRWVKKSYET